MTQPEPAGAPADRIALSRLANHGIATPTFAQPGDVVTWLGALQAQDYGGALWAIGLRMTGATERSIEQAIAERTIVRTWPMRGTLHFVAAQDVRWLLALLTPRVIAHSAGRYRQLELDEVTFARQQRGVCQGVTGRASSSPAMKCCKGWSKRASPRPANAATICLGGRRKTG